MAVKRDAVRDVYLDYGLQKSSDGTRGIMPGKDVADLFFGKDGFVRLSWDVITHVIDSLIRDGGYLPFHEEEDAIGDFDIPDEDISEENVSGGVEDTHESTGDDSGDGQLSLFEFYPGPYEEDGQAGDHILC